MLTVLGLMPVLLTPFGFLDDYNVLFKKQTDPGPTLDAALVQGRPVAGLLQGVAFWFVDDIDGLVLLRAFSVACLAMFAAVSVKQLLRAGYSPGVTVMFATAMLVLPSTTVMAAWSILLMGPAALLLSLLAAAALARRLDDVLAVRTAPVRGVVAALPAVGLLIAAVLAYQPSAMVFWPVVLLFLLAPARRRWSEARLLAGAGAALLVGVSACAAGYVAVKSGVAYVGGGAPRTALVTDVPDKLAYVAGQALPRVLDPWSLAPRPAVAWCTGIGLVLLLVVAVEGSLRRRLLVLALWCTAGVLSYLPSLATAENWASARSLSAAFVVPFVGAALVLQGLAGRSPIPLALRAGGAALLSVAAVFWSNDVLRTYWTVPQGEELARARAHIAPVLEGRPERVLVVRSDYTQTLAPAFSYDEAGVPSTYAAWVPVALTQMLARETTGRFLPDVRLVERSAVPPLGDGVLLVDYGAVLQPSSGPAVRAGGR